MDQDNYLNSVLTLHWFVHLQPSILALTDIQQTQHVTTTLSWGKRARSECKADMINRVATVCLPEWLWWICTFFKTVSSLPFVFWFTVRVKSGHQTVWKKSRLSKLAETTEGITGMFKFLVVTAQCLCVIFVCMNTGWCGWCGMPFSTFYGIPCTLTNKVLIW